MKKINKPICALLLLSTLLPSAHAALSVLGPEDPSHGFPKWYKDSKGVRLQLCLENTPLCALEDSNRGARIKFPTNFPSESLWWGANAKVRFGNPRAEVSLLYGLEAAFAGEVPKAGDRLAFGRVRIRGRGLTAGTYRITHPYDQETFEVDDSQSGDRQINETRDVGVEPEVFSGALQSGIGPFLVWDPTVAPLAPKGFVGNPEVPHKVIGSPRGTNFLRVEKLEGNRFVEVAFTDEFNVIGKKATGPEEPVLSIKPRGGIFVRPQVVTIKSTVSQATIFYTLDGSNPLTSTTRQPYTGPLTLPPVAALRFGATNGKARSEVSTELYVQAQ